MKLGEALGEDMCYVVPEGAGVPAYCGLVHDAPDAVHHEHDVVDVRKAVRGVTKLLVASEDSVT